MRCRVGFGVGDGSHIQNRNRVFYIRSLTWDEWSYPQLLLLWGLSDPRIAELFLIKKTNLDMLGVNP